MLKAYFGHMMGVCRLWSAVVCVVVDELNDCATDYINFCVDIQIREKKVIYYPKNKPWVTKDLKKTINENKFLFAQGDRMAHKLKQKVLRKEIIKCREIYKKKIETHFKQDDMKERWRGIKKITGIFEAKVSSSIKPRFK